MTYFSCKDERNVEIFKDEICKVREHKADGLRISQVCKMKKNLAEVELQFRKLYKKNLQFKFNKTI